MKLPIPKQTGTRTTVSQPKPNAPQLFNPQGYGKAGNNAIDIMIAQGHFNGKEKDLNVLMTIYGGLAKAIYKEDIKIIKELKSEISRE